MDRFAEFEKIKDEIFQMAAAACEEVPKSGGDYRHDPLLMRFLENCSLLMKLVSHNIGINIHKDHNVVYCEAINKKWMIITKKFTGTNSSPFIFIPNLN